MVAFALNLRLLRLIIRRRAQKFQSSGFVPVDVRFDIFLRCEDTKVVVGFGDHAFLSAEPPIVPTGMHI